MSILDNIKNIKKTNIKVMNGDEEMTCYSLGGFLNTRTGWTLWVEAVQTEDYGKYYQERTFFEIIGEDEYYEMERLHLI
ncbi:hypothetical protein [Finegoldia magna]|uniref:hypothetical protein n=1 Tax=Finegoldia magna TaxID=1260 RepID=UPI001CE1625E|nr:hypothetical protein [Finegoldia magna]MCA5587702.1 hypothetical protein [Finegoldia magna]